VRVLIADDHALFRQGLRSLLETIDDIEIVGEAEDGHETVEMADSLKPDLILMDIAMPGFDGLEATRRLKDSCPDTKILILTMHADHPYVQKALRAGVSGYIFKGAPFNELQAALDSIKRGSPYLSPALLGPLLNDYRNLTPDEKVYDKYKELSLREREIFELLVQGFGRRDIADHLLISPKTVDRHKRNIKDKLNVKSDLDMQEIARMLKQS